MATKQTNKMRGSSTPITINTGSPGQQDQVNSTSQNVVLISHKKMSLIGLCVGFLFVWTLVLVGVLVRSSMKEGQRISEITKLFNVHQDLGRVTFALGHEMISTVDLLLTESQRKGTDSESDQILSITWQMTDSIMFAIRERAPHTWPGGTSTVLDVIYEKMAAFREKNLNHLLTPIRAVDLYADMCDVMDLEYQAQGGGFYRFSGQESHLSNPHSTLASVYPLFNEAMGQRFAELALGTYYFRSNGSMNGTRYLGLHYGSRDFMSLAFQFNSRTQRRYFQAAVQDPQIEQSLRLVASDLLAGGPNRTSNAFAARYLDGVKEEMATLLLAKDFLNTTLAGELYQLSEDNRNELSFRLFCSTIGVIAVGICLGLVCFSLTSKNQGLKPEILKSEFSKEKQQQTSSSMPPMQLSVMSQIDSSLANTERTMGLVGSLEATYRPISAERSRYYANVYDRQQCYL